MDYGLGRMSSNAMLGMTAGAGSGSHLLNNHLSALENGRDGLRMASPNGSAAGNNNNTGANNNGDQQLLSPNSHQAVGAVPSQGSALFSRNLSRRFSPVLACAKFR
jgi:hypothetical protein